MTLNHARFIFGIVKECIIIIYMGDFYGPICSNRTILCLYQRNTCNKCRYVLLLDFFFHSEEYPYNLELNYGPTRIDATGMRLLYIHEREYNFRRYIIT